MSSHDAQLLLIDSLLWSLVKLGENHRRLSHTATQVGSYLFIFGGHDGANYVQDLLLFNLGTSCFAKQLLRYIDISTSVPSVTPVRAKAGRWQSAIDTRLPRCMSRGQPRLHLWRLQRLRCVRRRAHPRPRRRGVPPASDQLPHRRRVSSSHYRTHPVHIYHSFIFSLGRYHEPPRAAHLFVVLAGSAGARWCRARSRPPSHRALPFPSLPSRLPHRSSPWSSKHRPRRRSNLYTNRMISV